MTCDDETCTHHKCIACLTNCVNENGDTCVPCTTSEDNFRQDFKWLHDTAFPDNPE